MTNKKEEVPVPEKESELTPEQLAALAKPSLIEFLQEPEGREFTIQFFDKFMELTGRFHRNSSLELILKSLVVLGIAILAAGLSYFGKFDASIGVLMGTMVGYLFGRNDS